MSSETPSQTELPDKLYFRIGEVSKIAGIPSYVLRFWETEFSNILPKRTPKGHRLYRKADVERILTIKHLLYDRKYTIQGAKQYFKPSHQRQRSLITSEIIDEILEDLENIRKLIE